MTASTWRGVGCRVLLDSRVLGGRLDDGPDVEMGWLIGLMVPLVAMRGWLNGLVVPLAAMRGCLGQLPGGLASWKVVD